MYVNINSPFFAVLNLVAGVVVDGLYVSVELLLAHCLVQLHLGLPQGRLGYAVLVLLNMKIRK